MSVCNFDATQVQPQKAFEPVPAGWVVAKLIASELKATQAAGGSYDAFELEIIEGPHAGRKLFDRPTRTNANDVAVRIGQERLSAYCHATGVLHLQDTQQLHGIPVWVKVGIRKQDGYEDSNEVKAVQKITDTPKGCQPAGSGAAPAAGFNGQQFTGAPVSLPPQHPVMQQPPGMPAQATFAPPPSFGGMPPGMQQAAPAWAGQAPAPQAPQFAPPPSAPPPQAPPPPAQPAQPQYKVGDIANGHQLTPQGWQPLPAGGAPQPANQAPWGAR
jgi:hypothetical protein